MLLCIKPNWFDLDFGILGFAQRIYGFYVFHTKVTFSFSSCDSRNLNLSPFCDTSSTSLALWQPSVLETYGEEGKLDYLDKITGPMRKKYPNSMGDRELITSLTEVRIQYLSINSWHIRSFCKNFFVISNFQFKGYWKVIINSDFILLAPQRCSSSHNSLRGITHSITITYSNSVLTFPNNIGLELIPKLTS